MVVEEQWSGVTWLGDCWLCYLRAIFAEENMSMDGKMRCRELTVLLPTSWAVVAMSRDGQQHDMKREEGTSTSTSES